MLKALFVVYTEVTASEVEYMHVQKEMILIQRECQASMLKLGKRVVVMAV